MVAELERVYDSETHEEEDEEGPKLSPELEAS
jgi:hypothetical protein